MEHGLYMIVPAIKHAFVGKKTSHGVDDTRYPPNPIPIFRALLLEVLRTCEARPLGFRSLQQWRMKAPLWSSRFLDTFLLDSADYSFMFLYWDITKHVPTKGNRTLRCWHGWYFRWKSRQHLVILHSSSLQQWRFPISKLVTYLKKKDGSP